MVRQNRRTAFLRKQILVRNCRAETQLNDKNSRNRLTKEKIKQY